MKVYVLKKAASFGEFENPATDYATNFVFLKKEDGERLAEELNNLNPKECKGSWSLPFFVREHEVIEDYSKVAKLICCGWCNGTGNQGTYKCSSCNGTGKKNPSY